MHVNMLHGAEATSQKSGLSRRVPANLGGSTVVIFSSSFLSASIFSWLMAAQPVDSCAAEAKE